jgi:hypothetical protein
MNTKVLIVAVIVILAGFLVYNGFGGNDDLDNGIGGGTVDNSVDSVGEDPATTSEDIDMNQTEPSTDGVADGTTGGLSLPSSSRDIQVTSGVKHSIPLDEVLGGGPAKDGIPSIDDPKFIGIREAEDFLENSEIGLGLSMGGTDRFYPYQILVFHELVNDTIAGQPVLVTYCPLCATGIVFDRRVDGKAVEFGVSGFLWQSNLLMYDRTSPDEKGSSYVLGGFRGASFDDFDSDKQSLWSQVLGEAVWGTRTGERLPVISSDTVLFGEWKEKNPGGEVLSRDTGASRSYGFDPYGGNTPIIGASVSDDRLDAKAFVLGVEIDGNKYKAYLVDAIPEGVSSDTFAGNEITLERTDIGEVRIFAGAEKKPVPYIGGFWFSWAAVHPETDVFK